MSKRPLSVCASQKDLDEELVKCVRSWTIGRVVPGIILVRFTNIGSGEQNKMQICHLIHVQFNYLCVHWNRYKSYLNSWAVFMSKVLIFPFVIFFFIQQLWRMFQVLSLLSRVSFISYPPSIRYAELSLPALQHCFKLFLASNRVINC